jgi:hypothetical protein
MFFLRYIRGVEVQRTAEGTKECEGQEQAAQELHSTGKQYLVRVRGNQSLYARGHALYLFWNGIRGGQRGAYGVTMLTWQSREGGLID